MQRRYQLEHTADIMPVWSYLATYNQTAGTFGTGHGSDLLMFASGYPAVPYKNILRYYISFVNYLDPNRITGGCHDGNRSTQWPRYTVEDKQMIQFGVDGESILRDDFRAGSYAYFKKVISQLRL
jgi:carboxylesterase type B